ncbi:MAG TPA: TonB family protein [Puia sp.]|jgi:TonB family protein|nr:TonB family protein [Puia sp.]
MSLILFLSKMIFVSFVLYCYYWLFLRNKKFHQYNRFFLLSIPVLAICIPLLNIRLAGIYGSHPGAGITLLKAVSINGWGEEVVIVGQKNWVHSLVSWQNILISFYAIIALILFWLLVRSLLRIIYISGKYLYEKINGIRFYQTTESGTPFSFLNNIFWNIKIDMNSEAGRQIFRHELYHVKQNHTSDILFLELLCAVSWFNPFFHLIKKELKAVHEFLADQYAATATNNHEYAELLVWESIAIHRLNISNPFFNNQIKRRILMITQFKNSRYSYIRRVMALPLMFILFCAFGLKITNKAFPDSLHAYKPITIIIDAGHGGIDPGTISKNGIAEKDIALAIAKQIQFLSKDYNVHVIMTREADMLPGNAATIKEGLSKRINIAASNNADLFISIHMDATINSEPKNGFSIYLSNNNPYYKKSMELGSVLTEEIKKTCTILPELKERQHGIMVLQASSMPAVMVECGYITDKNDLAFITTEENQTKIAKDILEGVVKYSISINNSANNTSNIIQDPIASADPAKINTSQITRMSLDESQTLPKNDFNNEFNEGFSSDTSGGKIYSKVEIESDYPGGPGAWVRYLNKNFKYPQEAINREIQGTVVAQFIVNVDGTVSGIKIFKSDNKMLNEEVIRIIKNSGKWIPAMQNGQKVRSYKRQPLVFKLERQQNP